MGTLSKKADKKRRVSNKSDCDKHTHLYKNSHNKLL